MTTELQKVDCPCGFSVQSHDANEVLEIIKKHAKQSHGHEFTDGEIRQAMRTVVATVE